MRKGSTEALECDIQILRNDDSRFAQTRNGQIVVVLQVYISGVKTMMGALIGKHFAPSRRYRSKPDYHPQTEQCDKRLDSVT